MLAIVWQKTETLPGLDEETLKKLFPPYKVLLHNDDDHAMDYVVQALQKSVPDLTEEECMEIMFTAHNEGSAVVVVCPQETAEFYRDRILTFGLIATIEPDVN